MGRFQLLWDRDSNRFDPFAFKCLINEKGEMSIFLADMPYFLCKQ